MGVDFLKHFSTGILEPAAMGITFRVERTCEGARGGFHNLQASGPSVLSESWCSPIPQALERHMFTSPALSTESFQWGPGSLVVDHWVMKSQVWERTRKGKGLGGHTGGGFKWGQSICSPPVGYRSRIFNHLKEQR